MNRPRYGDILPHQNVHPDHNGCKPAHKLPLKTENDTVPVKVDPETGKLYVPEYPGTEQKMINFEKEYNTKLNKVNQSISSVNSALDRKAENDDLNETRQELSDLRREVDSFAGWDIPEIIEDIDVLEKAVNSHSDSIANTDEKVNSLQNELDNTKGAIVDESGNYSLVKGIKGSAETGSYRTGKVVITPADIGTYTKEEIEALTQGRSKGLVLTNEDDMEEILINPEYIGKLSVGDNILIKEVEVPDYWITDTSETLRGYNGITVINQEDYNAGWRGYYCISPLETRSIDLSDYQKNTDGNLKTDSKEIVGAINEIREYSNASPTTIAVGGIAKGTTFDKVPITEVIDRLLYPYVAFSLGSLTTSPSGGVFEIGTSKFVTSCTIYVNYGTAKITKIEILDGSSNVLATKTNIKQVGTSGESFTINLNYTITTNQALKARVTDSAGTVKTASSSNFTFVNPYYYGVISDGVEITESLVKGLTKLVTTKQSMTRTYTMAQQKAVLAYPASYGSLSKILDENSFNVTETFVKSTLTINSVSYYVYVLDKPATSTMKYTFNY